MKPLLLIIAMTFSVMAQEQSSSATPQPSPLSRPIDIATKLKTTKGKDKIILKYDRFKDYTVVMCKPFDLLTTGERMAVGLAQGMSRGPYGRSGPSPADTYPSEFRMGVGFGFKGSTLDRAPVFALVFTSGGSGWRFLKDRKLYVLIDGDRMELGEGSHDGDVYFGGVSEQMLFSLSREQLETIAHGKIVEIQLGGFERKLKSGNLERLKIVLSLLKP